MNSSALWQFFTKLKQTNENSFFFKTAYCSEIYDLALRGYGILFKYGLKCFFLSLIHHLTQDTPIDLEYQMWILENEPSTEGLIEQKKISKDFPYRPLISILTPVYNVPSHILENTIKSVLEQTYDNWELCIVDAHSDNQDNRDIILNASKMDTRIKYKFLDNNYGISQNSNIAFSLTNGEFIGLLDHDDLIAPFALYEVVNILNKKPDLDFIYSDRDIISENGENRFSPFFKPDWSPEIMFSGNYLTHLCIIRKKLIEKTGGFSPEADGAQDWDLFLRITDITSKIFHIPKILYHWRLMDSSCSKKGFIAKPFAFYAQQRTLENHLKRRKLSGNVIPFKSGLWRIKWTPNPDLKISIIIPSKNVYLLKSCIESIRKYSSHRNFEIIILDIGFNLQKEFESLEFSPTTNSVTIVPHNDALNIAKVRNLGAHKAKGDILLFLDENLEVISSDWLDEMAGWSIQNGIGIVGAKVLTHENKIAHAGVVLGLAGIVGNPFKYAEEDTWGPFGSSEFYRNYLAVNGSCLMITRKLFEQFGGFDEEFQVLGSDIDLGIRLYESNFRNVFTPFARLKIRDISHELSMSTDIDQQLIDYIRFYKKYKKYILQNDPYFNKNLSLIHTVPTIKTISI